MVIVLHFNIQCGHAFELASNTINIEILHLLESASICAVNTFVLITGYFLCQTKKIRISKAISLIIQASLFALILYFVNIILGVEHFSFGRMISCFLPNSWFTFIYVSLYLLAPYINKLINNIDHKQFNNLLMTMFTIFSFIPFTLRIINEYLGWNTTGINFISIQGNIEGYTIINFILLYLIGAYIRLHYNKKSNMIYFIYIGMTLCIYLGDKLISNYSTAFYDYSNPFIILEAICMFLIFKRTNIKNNRIINLFSKQAYSVYLLHPNFYFLFNVEKIVSMNPCIMIVMIFILCVALYIISWGIGMICEKVMNPILNLIFKRDTVIKV